MKIYFVLLALKFAFLFKIFPRFYVFIKLSFLAEQAPPKNNKTIRRHKKYPLVAGLFNKNILIIP